MKEDFGTVDTKSLRRRKPAAPKAPSNERQQQQRQRHKQSVKPKSKKEARDYCYHYKYNKEISILTIPCFISLFFLHSKNFNENYDDTNISNNNLLVLVSFFYCSLWLYILDLANWKDGFPGSIWFSLFIIVCILVWEWCTTSRETDYRFFGSIAMSNYYYDDDGDWMMVMMYWKIKLESWCIFLFSIWNLIGKIMFFFCLACWTILQRQPSKHTDVKDAKYWEEMLHFNLPISFSTIMSFTLLQLYQPHNNYYYNEHDELNNYHEWKEINFVWTIIPFIFTFCFSWSIKLLCNLQSSFHENDDSTDLSEGNDQRIDHSQQDLENTYDPRQEQRRIEEKQKQDRQQLEEYYTIPSSYGCYLSYMLLGIPIAVYTVSYLIQQNNCQFVMMMTMNKSMSALSTSTVQFASFSWTAMMLDLVVIILVPYLIHCYYLDHGLWWKGELLSILNNEERVNENYKRNNNQGNVANRAFSISIGKTTLHMRSIIAFLVVTEVIIHRYLTQMCLIFAHHIHHDEQSGVILSKPIIWLLLNCCIGFLGASFWWTDRRKQNQKQDDLKEDIDEPFVVMILMSSLCAGGALSLPWTVIVYLATFVLAFGLYIPTKKLQYMVASLGVLLVGISSMYFKWFKEFDKSVWIIPGMMKLSILHFHIIFFSGSFLCGIIYAISKRHTNNRWLSIVLATYTIFVLLMEGVLLYEPLNFLEESLYSNLLVIFSSLLLIGITASLKHRKAINDTAYLVSISVSIGKAIASTIESETHQNFIASSWVAALFVFVVAVPFMLIRPLHLKERGRTNSFRKKSSVAISDSASILITLFCSLILPFAIFKSMPVLELFISILVDGGSGQSYYSHSLSSSEVMGYSMIIWGICVWSLLYYHFPKGGAESWRNRALFCFLCGLFICIIPFSYPMLYRRDNTPSFIFASIGSFDSIMQQHEEKGLWGLVAISIGILLALFEPPNLRRGNTSRVKYARLVIFSILIGGGSSWFLVFQFIGDFTKFQTVVMVMSSMLNGIMYTVAALHYIDERHFSVKMGKISISVASVSTSTTGIVFALSTNMAGHSISIIFSLWALYSLLLGMSLRARREKNNKTRALANLCFVLSWLFLTVVVYGYFGIASIGVSTSFNHILGFPASIVFTLTLALILLCVELEPESKSKYGKSKETCFGISLPYLSDEQRYFLPVVAAGTTFVLASLYVILLRGLCNQWLTQAAHATYESIFQSNYGSASRITHHGNVAELAKKKLLHDKVVAITSKLAASGYWTSTSIIGPMKHLLGLISILPTWISLASQFKCPPEIRHSTLIDSLPYNLFPILFCKGIPSLTAATWLGVTVAMYKYHTLKQKIKAQ